MFSWRYATHMRVCLSLYYDEYLWFTYMYIMYIYMYMMYMYMYMYAYEPFDA